MSPLSPLNERELHLLVRYSLDPQEDMSMAILSAFLALGVDVSNEPTQLTDWINADILDDLHWSSDRPLYLCTRIWDHLVVMTPEEVRIYKEGIVT